jgi:hypothetical protein
MQMTKTKATILNSLAVGLLLVIGPTHGVAQSAGAASAEAKPAVVSEAVIPPGLVAADVPSFPAQISRAPFVGKLSALPVACGPRTASAVADGVDAAAGQRDASRAQALANLVMTENALSPFAAQSIIMALGRYPGSNDMLRKIVKHAHAIAARQYEAQEESEGKSTAPADAVIASMEQDILMAAIRACTLAHTPAMKALLGELGSSMDASVAEMATAALTGW